MAVRLDKWLQVARVFKTRSQATRACAAGRVEVNGVKAKAHRPLAIGDRVSVRLERGRRREVEVRVLAERPLPKAAAAGLFEDLSPPPPRRSRPLAGPVPARERGAGRPSKRERRELDRLRQRRS